MSSCPLCLADEPAHYHRDRRRSYLQCGQCHLIFADPESQLSQEAEKAIYDQHENDPEDQGYRRFLNRLAEPLLTRLAPASTGLDFGCGPGPTLSLMLAEAGHRVAVYDPYFAPQTDVLAQQYDFITCTEAIEHFNTPRREWQQLLAMLKPGGWLGIMTKLAQDKQAFAKWHYKNDPTHVSFFSRACFHWLAQQDELEIEFQGADVIILRKPGNTTSV